MGTSWVALSIKNIKTRASREMTSHTKKKINFFDFNGVNVAKHWHVAGRGICHLWLSCCSCFCLIWNISGTYLGEKLDKYSHIYVIFLPSLKHPHDWLLSCLWHWPVCGRWMEKCGLSSLVQLGVCKLTFQWHKYMILCSTSHPDKSLKCI